MFVSTPLFIEEIYEKEQNPPINKTYVAIITAVVVIIMIVVYYLGRRRQSQVCCLHSAICIVFHIFLSFEGVH